MQLNWTCPHCERHVVITDQTYSGDIHRLRIENADGRLALTSRFYVCPNPRCRKYTLEVALRPWVEINANPGYSLQEPLRTWRLVPWGKARAFPHYIPLAIRNDYAEAHSILELSPKAAATLARRAVQGIVRDYWKIVKATLNLELQELEKRVGQDITRETWEGIDAVRSVGNIGAHMEKDIDLIVEVEAGEAALLIELVETLIEDTYIARHERQERHAQLMALKEAKAQERKGG